MKPLCDGSQEGNLKVQTGNGTIVSFFLARLGFTCTAQQQTPWSLALSATGCEATCSLTRSDWWGNREAGFSIKVVVVSWAGVLTTQLPTGPTAHQTDHQSRLITVIIQLRICGITLLHGNLSPSYTNILLSYYKLVKHFICLYKCSHSCLFIGYSFIT